MHHCLRYLSLLLALMLVGGGFVGCSNDDTENSSKPSVRVALGTVGPYSAEINLTTTAIAEYAWLCYPADKAEEPTATIIFATGTTGTCKNGNNIVTIPDLESLTDYVVYLAFKTTKNAFYEGAIAPVAFKTTDYTDEITIAKRTYDGFVAHVKVPKSVTDNGNVLRWVPTNLVVYNMNKMSGLTDADLLKTNDEMYGWYFDKPKTITIDEAHRMMVDKDGNPVLDEEGEQMEYWDPIAPGEPLYLLLGEYAYGEDMFSWGMGWYAPLFDYDAYYEELGGGGEIGPLMSRADAKTEADFWTGYHKKVEVRAKEPAVLDAKVKFETIDARPNGSTLRFTPDEKVTQYCVCVMDNAMYTGQMLQLLNNDESLMQWFTTSLVGMMTIGSQTFYEPTEFLVEDMFYEMTPGVPYHVFITAMGDEKGTIQSFAHETFELPEATLPAPVVEVKGIKNPDGEDSPYEVWFNIKSPTKDVTKVVYACEDVRKFISELNNGYSYASLIEQNASYASLSNKDLAKVNSDSGLNMAFSSREDATTRLAVMGWNREGTANNPDEEDSPAIADMRTIREPDASRVESALFKDLLGDWTATATVKYLGYNEQWESVWLPVAEPQKSKVTISAGVTYPTALPENVYAIFEGMTKAQVDALYADFKECADIYNSKVRGQNRLLCLGYDFDANASGSMEAATPYDLFVHASYGSATNEGLFYDFGPKWYLQIAAGDKAFVPVNVNRLAPLSAWTFTDMEFYLATADNEGALYTPAEEDMNNIDAWPNIPVEISANKNTITLKSVKTVIDNVNRTFYPTVLYYSYGAMNLFSTRVVSEVVLTKGWTEPASAKASVKARRSNPAVPSMSNALGRTLKPVNNGVLKPMEQLRAKTPFVKTAPIHYKRVENMRVVTTEQFKANVLKFNEQMKQRSGRK